MATIEFTEEELRVLISAARTYMDDFGHDEHEIRDKVRAVVEKLERSAAA